MQQSTADERGMVVQLACALSSVEECRLATGAYLDQFDIDERDQCRVEVILEELVSNVVRHGRNASSLTVAATYCDGLIKLVVEDNGSEFNPLEMPEPARFTALNDAKLGGLGISMVRKLAHRVSYDRAECGGASFNRVTIEIASRKLDG